MEREKECQPLSWGCQLSFTLITIGREGIGQIEVRFGRKAERINSRTDTRLLALQGYNNALRIHLARPKLMAKLIFCAFCNFLPALSTQVARFIEGR